VNRSSVKGRACAPNRKDEPKAQQGRARCARCIARFQAPLRRAARCAGLGPTGQGHAHPDDQQDIEERVLEEVHCLGLVVFFLERAVERLPRTSTVSCCAGRSPVDAWEGCRGGCGARLACDRRPTSWSLGSCTSRSFPVETYSRLRYASRTLACCVQRPSAE